jgi:peptidoglycan hydrolase-like protein with peptidoglycan-binding domain
MKGIVAPTMAALAVLYALTVLLSVDRAPSGPALVKSKEEISDLGSRLIQAVMLQRRQEQSQDHPGSPNADQTMKVQQALKDNGFYAGPIDGVMRKRTQEAIESFQQSKHLKVTGTIDEDTARELHIR